MVRSDCNALGCMEPRITVTTTPSVTSPSPSPEEVLRCRACYKSLLSLLVNGTTNHRDHHSQRYLTVPFLGEVLRCCAFAVRVTIVC